MMRILALFLVAIVAMGMSACTSAGSRSDAGQSPGQPGNQAENQTSESQMSEDQEPEDLPFYRSFYQPVYQFVDQYLDQIEPKVATGALVGGTVIGLSASAFGGGMGKTLITAGGILTGSYIGSLYMQRLGGGDRQRAQNAADLAQTLPVGQTASWHNPSVEISGSTTPVLEGIDDRGRFCRQYQHIVTVGDQSRQEYATICLESDGRWQPAP